MALAAGAKKVWVTDNPVNNAERCFERSGIFKAAGAAGGTLVVPNGASFREVPVGEACCARPTCCGPSSRPTG